MEPGHSITDGEPDHVRADLGDGAAEVEPQSDLFGQAEGLLVGRDERVEVRERGGRDGDPYVTSVDLLRDVKFDDRRLIRSAAGNERLHGVLLDASVDPHQYQRVTLYWEDGTSKSAAHPEVTP